MILKLKCTFPIRTWSDKQMPVEFFKNSEAIWCLRSEFLNNFDKNFVGILEEFLEQTSLVYFYLIVEF